MAAKGSKLHRSLLRKRRGSSTCCTLCTAWSMISTEPCFKRLRVSSLRPKNSISICARAVRNLGGIQQNLTDFVVHTENDQEESLTNNNWKCLFATDVQWYLYWVQNLQNWVTAFYLKKKSTWFQLFVLPVWCHLFVDHSERFLFTNTK